MAKNLIVIQYFRPTIWYVLCSAILNFRAIICDNLIFIQPTWSLKRHCCFTETARPHVKESPSSILTNERAGNKKVKLSYAPTSMSSFIMFELEVAEKEKKRLLSYSMEN